MCRYKMLSSLLDLFGSFRDTTVAGELSTSLHTILVRHPVSEQSDECLNQRVDACKHEINLTAKYLYIRD